MKMKISAIKQGELSVIEYANLLKNLWQEMDHYQCIQMKDSEDIAILKIFVEKERIFEFFANLNLEFDQVQVQVLGKGDLPSLNETISIIRVEEGKEVKSSQCCKQTTKFIQVVQLLQETGHAKDMCWNLHGRPPNFNNNNRDEDPVANSSKKVKDRQISPTAIHQAMRMRPQHMVNLRRIYFLGIEVARSQ
ncbi:hypothetical protein CK203_096480 [Vitis vinifera]|uniref:Retrotransposon gag domain-containing protein n=1 Tax=Vitis vinifera TaxID=29760 RepID=A0A438DGD6_VITVI|nr:hypothetical protein CK203_096480 [Vitis vinifera]